MDNLILGSHEFCFFYVDKTEIREDGYSCSGTILKDGCILDNFEGVGTFATFKDVKFYLFSYLLNNNLVIITKDNIQLYYEFMSNEYIKNRGI